jgi:hypothetical protein
MQFGRESTNDERRGPGTAVPISGAAHDAKGWICSKDPDHFRLVSA